MSDFHFLRPAWFLALAPVLGLLVLLWRRGRRAAGWQGIVSPVLLPHLLLDRGQAGRRLPLFLLGLGWLLAVAALAGPTWERQPQPVYRAPADRVVVLDMSPSMGATDLKPDRLTRARIAIRSLLAEMREGRTALVVFGAEPHVVAPLTDDVATIEALLPALTADILPAPGNRGGPALRAAAALLERVGSARGEVLLMSDGIDDPADSLGAIHDLARRGVRTSVLGVGAGAEAPKGAAQGGLESAQDPGVRPARLDEPGLTALARAGGGAYQRLGREPVSALLSRNVDRGPAGAPTDQTGLERWVEKGPWLLLPLVLIAAGGFRRGWLGVLALLLIPPPQAQALGWPDLWLRPDQQAARLLEQGEAAAAAARFEDRDWQALARYRAGDYAAAAEGFAGEDADSRYNRGNALARAGRLQEAIAAYDQALRFQPAHGDARFNRELVEKLLQAQQQPPDSAAPSDSARNESGAGDPREGNTGDNRPAEKAESGAGQPQPGDAPERTGEEPSAGDAEGPDPRQSGTDAGPEPAAKPAPSRDPAAGEPAPNPPDSAEQARADVAPAVDGATPDPSGTPAQSAAGGVEQTGAKPGNDARRAPMSERQLALEQWLRQVPDDPAGLLRRKFMLEHLRRQENRRSP